MRALSGSVTVTPPAMLRSTPPPMPAVNTKTKTPTPSPVTAPEASTSTQTARRSSLWLALVGVIAVLACAALGWAVFRSGSPDGSAMSESGRAPVGTPMPTDAATPVPSGALNAVPSPQPTVSPLFAPRPSVVQTRIERVLRHARYRSPDRLCAVPACLPANDGWYEKASQALAR
jgi:hypothetical protein